MKTVMFPQNTWPSEAGSGGQSVYDVVIAADGSGQYTGIAAAFTAEGSGKSYLIKKGSYTEAADVGVPGGGTYVHSNGADVTLADGKKWYAAASGSTMTGSLTIHGGSGASAVCRFFEALKDNLDWGGCTIELQLIPDVSPATSSLIPTQMGGKHCRLTVRFVGKALNANGKGVIPLYVNAASQAANTGSRYDLSVRGFAVSNGAGSLIAILSEASLGNHYTVEITENTGFSSGLALGADTDYCAVAGAVYACGTELVNSGQGNTVTGLATGG